MTTDTPYPSAPPEEDARDGCCRLCSSKFHATGSHSAQTALAAAVGMTREEVLGDGDEFSPGYDPAEADRLIGRTPR